MTDREHRIDTVPLGGDQIPEDLKRYHADAKKGLAENESWKDCFVAELIERITKAEAALAQKTKECEEWRRKHFEMERAHSNAVDKISDLTARVQLREKDLVERGSQKSAFEQENIALRARVEQLGRQVAEMSKPVTDEEINQTPAGNVGIFTLKEVNDLLESRAHTK